MKDAPAFKRGIVIGIGSDVSRVDWSMLALLSAGVIVGLVTTWLPVMAASVSWLISSALRRTYRAARAWLTGAGLLLVLAGIWFGIQTRTLIAAGGVDALVIRPTSVVAAVLALGAAFGVAIGLVPHMANLASRTISPASRAGDAARLWLRRAAILLSLSAFALVSEAYKV